MPLIWNPTGSNKLEVSDEQYMILGVMKVLWPEDHIVKIAGKRLRLSKIFLSNPREQQELL